MHLADFEMHLLSHQNSRDRNKPSTFRCKSAHITLIHHTKQVYHDAESVILTQKFGHISVILLASLSNFDILAFFNLSTIASQQEEARNIRERSQDFFCHVWRQLL